MKNGEVWGRLGKPSNAHAWSTSVQLRSRRDEKEGDGSRRGGRQRARWKPILKVLKRTDRYTFQPGNTVPRRGAWVFRRAVLKHNLGPRLTMDCYREIQSARTFFRNGDNREERARFRQSCIHVTNMNVEFQSTSCSLWHTICLNSSSSFPRSPNGSNLPEVPQRRPQTSRLGSNRLTRRPLTFIISLKYQIQTPGWVHQLLRNCLLVFSLAPSEQAPPLVDFSVSSPRHCIVHKGKGENGQPCSGMFSMVAFGHRGSQGSPFPGALWVFPVQPRAVQEEPPYGS